jgi:hypothetical protein
MAWRAKAKAASSVSEERRVIENKNRHHRAAQSVARQTRVSTNAPAATLAPAARHRCARAISNENMAKAWRHRK